VTVVAISGIERGTTFSVPPPTAQIQLRDAEVVLRLGLDVHLFEARHAAVTRGLEQTNLGGRSSRMRTKFLLGLAGTGHALAIRDTHAYESSL
jgi:hypothetical protein